MKKKLFSTLLALVMLFSLLPFEAIAAEDDGDSSSTPSTETPDPGNSGTGSGDDTGAGDGGESEGGTGTEGEGEVTPTPTTGALLKTEADPVSHEPHVAEGEIDLCDPNAGNIVDDVNPFLFTKNKVETTGKVRVSSWTVTDKGVLKFTLSGAVVGDTVDFYVDVESATYGKATLKVPVKLEYQGLTITSPRSVAMGSTLKLTCASLEGTGSVMYEITDTSGVVSINGDILTPLKVGSATIKAHQAKSDTGEWQASPEITITVVKGDPKGSPTYTRLDRAGYTLEDVELKHGSLSVPGTLEWVLPRSTKVIAGTAYEWRFIPDDTTNYNTITGTVTPYTKSDSDFNIGSGTTERNKDGSFTTISFGDDDSSYKLTEYPDGSMCMVHTLTDGTVTTTTKAKNGTRTEKIEYPDGSSTETASDVSGITHTTITDKYGYASVQVYLPYYATSAAVSTGRPVELPIPELPRSDDRSDAPTITLSLATSSPVRVGIPVNRPSAGTVAVSVANNGRETVIKTSTTGMDMVYVTVSGSTTLKIFDNSKTFRDVTNLSWFADAAAFVTSRGLFQGMDAITFAPTETMSRAMLVTVLHNLEGNPYSYYYGKLTDVEDTWYETAASWAVSHGHISGYPDKTFRGNDPITREQLAVILYRYAGYPSVSGYVNSRLTDYHDYKSISPYAYQAMYWAVNSGVLYTSGRTNLAPGRPATRAEVAQTMKNLVEFLAG